MSSPPKIIIVGAGAAGIACACKLIENGFTDLIVLEAENRIGGRINSVEFGENCFVDLGAQWCHGETGNVVYEMVKDLDLLGRSHNNYQDNTYYLSNGSVCDKHVTDKLFQIAAQILDDEEGAKKSHQSEQFWRIFHREIQRIGGQRIPNDKDARRLATVLLDWFHKFYLCLESSESWFDVSTTGPFKYKECEGDPQWNWRDKGFQTILHVLMKKIPDSTKQLPVDDKIYLNKEVEKIVWDNNAMNKGGVTVECSDGSLYNADHVICTVSLGVLKHFHRNFSPELPAQKLVAIEAMGIGVVNKILLKFPKKWWPDDLKGFSLVWTEQDRKNLSKDFPHGPIIKEGDDNHSRSWLEDLYGFYVIDSNPKVLLGWIVGKMAAEVELLSDEIVTEGCMFLLRKFVGTKYDICEPDDVLRSKWKSNPHFNGSYSYITRESELENVSSKDLEMPLISTQSSKQTVLFAGEATHPEYYSTVHGAIETGFREADRILNIYSNAVRYV